METESSSDANETPELDLRGQWRFTLEMLQVYHDASRRLTDEAEDLLAQAMEKREAALAMLSRANDLAYQYAVAKDRATSEAKIPPTEDHSDIPW